MAVVIVALLLVLLPGGPFRPANSAASASTTLAPSGWSSISLPWGQFADIPFATTTNEQLNGSFLSTDTITVYVMNVTDFQPLVDKDIVVGYQYTTGQLWNGWINDTVPPGHWDLVFLDTLRGGTSGVSIVQPVVLAPTG